LALAAVFVTILVASTSDSSEPRWRRILPVAAGCAGVIGVTMIPIIAQGAWGDFVSDVFTGKSDYVALLGSNAFNSVSRAVTLMVSAHAPVARRLAATGPLISLVVLAALIVATRSRRPIRRSPRLVALGCFALVGLGATVPDFGPQHLTEAAPLLIGAGGIAVAVCWWSGRPRPVPARRRVAAAMAALSLVGAVVMVGIDARRPSIGRSDRMVAATFADFSGMMTSARNQYEVRSDLVALRSRTGGKVFIVTAEASFYYLAGGLRNPTPFDFPARTDFGASGETGVVRRLSQSHVGWVCLRRVTTQRSSTYPVYLEQQLRRRMQFVVHLHICDLYRRRHASRHAVEPPASVADRDAPSDGLDTFVADTSIA
jgi:hypothetical protein